MDEISTSFCFICLLHLANERGLKLESTAEELPLEGGDEEQRIGNLWDLKVSTASRISFVKNSSLARRFIGIQMRHLPPEVALQEAFFALYKLSELYIDICSFCTSIR